MISNTVKDINPIKHNYNNRSRCDSEISQVMRRIFFDSLGCEAPKWRQHFAGLIHVCSDTAPPSSASRPDPMTLMESCGPDFATYREVCEHPAWGELSSINLTATEEVSPSEAQCRGHRPSQFTSRSNRCDNVIDCVDRSDETGCKDAENSERGVSFLHHSTRKLRQQPKLTQKQLDSIGEWGTSGAPPRSRECGDGEHPIGRNCYPHESLCSAMPPDSDDFDHPDHVMICQNWTFWSGFTKTDELDVDGNQVRVNPEGGVVGYPCRGNYPGFIALKHFRISLRTPGGCMSVKARCPGMFAISW